MRANPADYELVAPRSLPAVLSLLAESPGAWLPIAGGTDAMVQYAAGKLPARKLVSIWNLPELRRIEVLPDEIQIGAGCTYTDLRESELINREFSLLSSAASWTGGIANQNRGTLGGNIVNASPAADSLPALLVYDAELLLVSATRGERRVPYANFHLGYRKTQLAPDELIRAVCLKKQFSSYFAEARKVGARNAQAIAKVCLAALGRLSNGQVEDIRLAMGSIAPVPLRLIRTERVIQGKRIDSHLIQSAKTTAAAEVRPIDDIRSTARYRAAVAGNLVAEFLGQLITQRVRSENGNDFLARWNTLPSEKAAEAILPCCGSPKWAAAMAARRPLFDEAALLSASDQVWNSLAESDWLEAFRSHPRIGESRASASSAPQSASWSGEEQQKVASAAEDLKAALVEGNRAYEQRFHRIFIVCATGKSAPEILAILQRRLQNDDTTELLEAAEQQRQIARLRLKKWLSS
ncbi:MAG: 2-oxo-4-hydroxy-4-carboxy-5-ureidoimidazoline decarboxylase [Candidatus Acidiferrum sp.]